MAKNSARQIRLAFLLHAWNSTLDYGENVLREAEQTEKLFNVRKLGMRYTVTLYAAISRNFINLLSYSAHSLTYLFNQLLISLLA